MATSLKDIVQAILGIKTTEIVSCPLIPVTIPGSSSAGAYTANDAMGTLVKLRVPKRGVLISATFFDLDYEGSQVDLMVFNHEITQVASEAAWTCSAGYVLNFITPIEFIVLKAHTASQTSNVTNIGVAYSAPEGYLYIQAVTRATPTIAAGSEPRFQLQVQSFDPAFKES